MIRDPPRSTAGSSRGHCKTTPPSPVFRHRLHISRLPPQAGRMPLPTVGAGGGGPGGPRPLQEPLLAAGVLGDVGSLHKVSAAASRPCLSSQGPLLFVLKHGVYSIPLPCSVSVTHTPLAFSESRLPSPSGALACSGKSPCNSALWSTLSWASWLTPLLHLLFLRVVLRTPCWSHLLAAIMCLVRVLGLFLGERRRSDSCGAH